MSADDLTESEPQDTRKIEISNRYPNSVYLAILRQTGEKGTDPWSWIIGEDICDVTIDRDTSPIERIKTNIRGGTFQLQKEESPEQPGVYIRVGPKQPEFSIRTNFTLRPNTYLDAANTKELVEQLQALGYQSEITVLTNGNRRMALTSLDKLQFEITLGWESAEFRRQSLMLSLLNDPQNADFYDREFTNLNLGHERQNIGLSVRNSHPEFVPEGYPLESKEQVLEYLEEIRKLSEVVGNNLVRLLGEPDKFDPVQIEWKPKTLAEAIWNDPERIKNINDLLACPITELNESLVRVIQVGRLEKNSPDLIDIKGMVPDAKRILSLIETYFGFKYQEGEPANLDAMNDHDKALLALGLALKLADSSLVLQSGQFVFDETATIAGISYRRYGESGRDRLEFYLQQDEKYSYNRDSAEAADFFLLHTTTEGQTYTRYEQIQSANVASARNWLQEKIKDGTTRWQPTDARQINRILLEKIVPVNAAGAFREFEDARIHGRIGMTDPTSIEFNLQELLKSVDKFLLAAKASDGAIDDRDAQLKFLVTSWTMFDAIHPKGEGNGRTGTLLFEAWCKQLFGENTKFEPSRRDNTILSRLMTTALSGNMDMGYFFGSKLDGDIQPLFDYVQSNIQWQ